MKVDRIFTLVNFIANKHQRNYLAPSEFNFLTEMVQWQLFKERYGLPEEYQPGQPLPRVAFEVTQKVTDDMRVFKTKATLNIDKDGQAPYPSDYVHRIGVRKNVTLKSELDADGDPVNKTRWVKVKLVDEDKLSYRLGSTIVAPSLEYPLFVLQGTFMQFYPITLQSVEFTYLRAPTPPKWAFTTGTNNRPLFDSANSTDIEFPEETVNDFVIRILSKLAIHIREPQLVEYAELKKNQGI